ncbi:MAG: ATP-dependent helicase HrpB, partial [Myxococcota bacterium]
SEHTISGEPALLSAILAERAAERDPAEWLPDDPELTRLCDRVRFVRRHRPELGLPDTGPDGLRALLPTLARRRRSLDDLRRAPWRDAILGELDWRQRPALDRLAPDRLDVPSGNRVRLDYPVDGPPILAVRIQEVFGWQDTPRILDGAIPVRLHLLAPNRRPAQITDDLRSFWTGSYAAVRRDLRGRYPKHSWPEDPLTARAEHRPRRRR